MKKFNLKITLNNSDIQLIEQSLIYQFLSNNKIEYTKSHILTQYFNEFNFCTNLLKKYFDHDLEIYNIKELENYLELIIPSTDKKLNGAFFTPDYIINYIINEIKPKESETNLDPSCGCGAFLVSLTDYYRKEYSRSIKEIVKQNIFGADILDYNIRRTKIILAIFALQYDEILEDSDFNIFNVDSLNYNWNNMFDNILGNPPYVKFQDLTIELRNSLSKKWKTLNSGAYNLYFAFFELGYSLLKSKGTLSYITPNNYFTSLSGEPLRKFFHRKKCIYKIVDFKHHKVFDAQTYTSISFINKNENENILYDRLDSTIKPNLFLNNLNFSPNNISDLNPKKWRLLKSDEQLNIYKIESIGIPLGKLFDICAGIATLKDEVYFVDGKKLNNGCFIKESLNSIYEIEEDCLRSVYKISDFKTQQDVNKNNRKIIFPYKIIKGTIFPIVEDEFKSKFPKCYKYLISEKEKLLNRDKGKINYEPFYVWGRNQGLLKKGKRITVPTFSQKPRFLIVEEENSFFTNGYGIFFKDQNHNNLFESEANPISDIKNIEVVQKILNSIVMEYYITKTSVSIEGGYPCFQKNFIEKFTIPILNEIEIEFIRKENNTSEINHFLISKYQIDLI